MRQIRIAALILVAALSLSACARLRWSGAGEYVATTRGTGILLTAGPFTNAADCSAQIPRLKHGQTYVCIFLPERPPRAF